MPSWQDEFLGALRERDKVEKAQEAVIGHCGSSLMSYWGAA